MLLRDRGNLTAGEVAGCFPWVSRPAVSKHLGVLRSAKLVQRHIQGREAHYTLETGPLAEMYRDYLRAFEPLWEQSLATLKAKAEARD